MKRYVISPALTSVSVNGIQYTTDKERYRNNFQKSMGGVIDKQMREIYECLDKINQSHFHATIHETAKQIDINICVIK